MHAHAHTKTRKEAWEREAQKRRQANTRQTTPKKRGIHTQMGCDETTTLTHATEATSRPLPQTPQLPLATDWHQERKRLREREKAGKTIEWRGLRRVRTSTKLLGSRQAKNKYIYIYIYIYINIFRAPAATSAEVGSRTAICLVKTALVDIAA